MADTPDKPDKPETPRQEAPARPTAPKPAPRPALRPAAEPAPKPAAKPAEPEEPKAPEPRKDAPKVNTALLYGLVADTMPMEGRDFSIEVADTGPDGRPTLTIKPLTEIGKAFAPLLVARLSKPMGESGVAVTDNGQFAETMTISTIRTRVEAEAMAARQARIREAEAVRKAKNDVAQRARSVRISRAGETSPVSQEEMAANFELKAAIAALERLKRLDVAVGKIRASVDNAARIAAENDAKAGRQWAVDMDAPLTSLFDRQDAIAKFTEKENLIGQMAMHAVEQDYLGGRAVNIAKQYIIPKK